MSPPSCHDELQDLSTEDAQELRAFLDKRRWFEAKLKILEELPPIYPFVHPTLSQPNPTAASSPPVYSNRSETRWNLPSEAEIKIWQDERTALEREILAFDGGDLVRIKDMTRAATLLPLTPPSTQLVSITLALVVLVDRLLTLLRHRGDLLELTSLRLQWDVMRWQIMQETAKVQAEIDEIAQIKGRWTPPQAIVDKSRARRPSVEIRPDSETTPASTPMPISAALPPVSDSSTSLSSLLEGPSLLITPSKIAHGISRSKRASVSSLSSLLSPNSPKRNFHLPLLHSSIINLDIRQRNLFANLISRSGKVLDKIIDVAIPLKNLGGAEGPTEEDQHGAVPDELLDIQDDIEGDMSDISGRIAWCQELEEQWKRADAHYLASSRAQEAALAFMDDIDLAISQAATSHVHRRLTAALAKAQGRLPDPIDSAFPRPSHSVYPEHDEHNVVLLEVLTSAHSEARSTLTRCEAGLAWYARLVDVGEKITSMNAEMEQLQQHLRSQIEYLTTIGEPLGRPDLGRPMDLKGEDSPWLEQLPALLEQSRVVKDQALDTNQKLALGIMQYRQIARAGPRSWRDQPRSEPALGMIDAVEETSNETLKLVDKLKSAAKESELDSQILPFVQNIINSATRVRSGISTLQSSLRSDIPIDLLEEHGRTANELADELKQIVAGDMQDVKHTLRSQQREIPPLSAYLVQLGDSLEKDLAVLRRGVQLDLAVAKQKQVVETIVKEAEGLDVRITTTQSLLDITIEEPTGDAEKNGNLPDDPHPVFASTVDEVDKWVASLAMRVTFVSSELGAATSLADSPNKSSGDRTLLLPATTSAAPPPMTTPETPPATPRAAHPTMIGTYSTPESKLAHSDAEARSRVNEASSRVKAALYRLQHAAATFDAARDRKEPVSPSPPAAVGQPYANDVFGTIAAVLPKSSAQPTDVTVQSLSLRLSELRIDQLIYPLSDGSHSTSTYRQIPSPPECSKIKDELDAIASALDHLAQLSQTDLDAEEIATLRVALASAVAHLSRLDALAATSVAVKACDDAFSQLLDQLDEYAESKQDQLVSFKDAAESALNTLRKVALAIGDDLRVRTEVERAETSWTELETLVEETLHPDAASIHSIDASSDVSSVVSATSGDLRRPQSRPSTRTASNPMSLPIHHIAEQRNRAASDTPSRDRLDSMRSGLPRLRKTSMVLSALASPARTPAHTGPSSIPRLKRQSQASPTVQAMTSSPSVNLTPKARTSSRLSTSPSVGRTSLIPGPRASIGSIPGSGSVSYMPRPRKAYVADPKSKLDMAIGKIVNKLEVNVPIRPVGMDKGEEWKDQSGKYWIGAEGRAKLCFCRILRSKTVMVRVGGGWVELSKFLLDHFADSLTGWNPTTNGLAGIGLGSSTPIPITSASRSTPLRPHSSLSLQPSATPETSTSRRNLEIVSIPVKSVSGSLKSSSIHQSTFLTPQRPQNPCGSTLRVGDGIADESTNATTGPTTPLVPLHFIRKASESPPIRQKEKEKFGAGKRSILGRSHSGHNVLASPSPTSSPEKDHGVTNS